MPPILLYCLTLSHEEHFYHLKPDPTQETRPIGSHYLRVATSVSEGKYRSAISNNPYETGMQAF